MQADADEGRRAMSNGDEVDRLGDDLLVGCVELANGSDVSVMSQHQS